jgi:hypothetical protein
MLILTLKLWIRALRAQIWLKTTTTPEILGRTLAFYLWLLHVSQMYVGTIHYKKISYQFIPSPTKSIPLTVNGMLFVGDGCIEGWQIYVIVAWFHIFSSVIVANCRAKDKSWPANWNLKRTEHANYKLTVTDNVLSFSTDTKSNKNMKTKERLNDLRSDNNEKVWKWHSKKNDRNHLRWR